MTKLIICASILCVIFIAACEDSALAQKSDSSLIIYDQFEYVVDRNDSKAEAIFKSKGGWNKAKTAQNPNSRHPGGYIYTVDRIPGYTGQFPGTNSQRVLAINALPATFGYQTDFYLEYFGNSSDAIPGDVWFQFWIYPNYYNDPEKKNNQPSGFGHHFKFIYPCKSQYPCKDASWLLTMGARSDTPFEKELGIPSQDLYVGLTNLKTAKYPGVDWNINIGQTDISELMVHNRWTLVKIHIDTSTTSGRYEVWLKPYNSKWIKVSEWIDGMQGFEWKISNPGGHRIFRMPTTVGRASNRDLYDSWIYFDDFAMANSEEDLPTYPD